MNRYACLLLVASLTLLGANCSSSRVRVLTPTKNLVVGDLVISRPILLQLVGDLFPASLGVTLNGQPLSVSPAIAPYYAARFDAGDLVPGQNVLVASAVDLSDGRLKTSQILFDYDPIQCDDLYGNDPTCAPSLLDTLDQLPLELQSYVGGHVAATLELDAAIAAMAVAAADVMALGFDADPLDAVQLALDHLDAALAQDPAADYSAFGALLAEAAMPWLRIDQIQMRGTHNSYHVEPFIPFSSEHEYTHVPLDQQLGNQGVRAFELDLHFNGSSYQVYHIAFIDAVTTCLAFTDCLQTIKTWSDAHSNHHPIVIWMEMKDDTGGAAITDYDLIDANIRSVFPEEQMITPDDVKRSFASVREGLDNVGWPTLAESRGTVLFVMLESNNQHTLAYTYGHAHLDGRVMFVNAPSSQWGLGWVAASKFNNPGDAGPIADALDMQLLVASNTGLAGDSAAEHAQRRADFLANGSHTSHDDFPLDLVMPGGAPSLCNPLTAPPFCMPDLLE